MFVGFDLGQTLVQKVPAAVATIACVKAGPNVGMALGIGAGLGMLVLYVLTVIVLEILFYVLASTGVAAAQVLVGPNPGGDDDDEDDGTQPPSNGAAA